MVARRIAAMSSLLGGLLALEVVLHGPVVVLGERLEQLVARRAGGLDVGRRDVDACRTSRPWARPCDQTRAFMPTRSMTPVKSASVPIGSWRTSGHGREARTDHVDAAVELGADAVELVDEADPRYGVAVGLAPDRLGLRLDPGDPVEHGDGAVEDAQRALHLDGEVDVARGVDDVDRVAVPQARGRGGRDRDAALLLLRHPVHRRGAFVHLADLVVDAGVEQDPLGRGGLARVDVGHDPDVADLGQGGGGVGCHGGVSLVL